MATLNTLYNQDVMQMGTGGNLAPIPSPTSLPMMATGGNTPAVPVMTMTTGGNNPPSVQQPVNQFSPTQVVQGMTNQLAPAGNQQGAAATVGNISNQIGGWTSFNGVTGPDGVQNNAAGVVQGLANQFNYTPQGSTAQLVQGINQAFAREQLADPTQVAMSSLEQIMNSDNPYMRSAIRRGLETAGSRGLLNSNMAAGLSQRAAVESSMPMFQEAMGLNRQRESQNFQETMASREQAFNLAAQREQEEYAKARAGFQAAAQMTGQDRQNAFSAAQASLERAQQLGMQKEQLSFQANQAERDWANRLASQREAQTFQGQQSSLDRATQLSSQREQLAFQAQQAELQRQQEVNNMQLASQLRAGERIEEAQLQNWLSSEGFAREFNAQLSLLPLQGAMDLNRAITQAAVTNPELYTPQVVSGMNEFFHNNMLSIMQQYFPGSGG